MSQSADYSSGSGTNPPFDYSWEDFSAHFQAALSPDEPTKMAAHFQSEYSNPQEARWKLARFAAARSFLEINHGRFEEFYIGGGPGGVGGMLDPRFMHALWRIYSYAPDNIATPFLPVKHVLDVARQA